MTFKEWYGQQNPEHIDEISAREAWEAAVNACWEAVNAGINRGSLPGNGCDQTAQRNGLVLATNIILNCHSPDS